MDLLALSKPTKDAIKESWVRAVGADSLPGVQFTEPAGDPGLFGPGSSIWYVHSDVATLVGGLSMHYAGKRIEWDDKKLEVVGMPEAQKFIKRAAYRKGWEYSAAKI